MHSPGGPRYDDLPPSYDEAQQQALNDARNGVPPLDPSDLDVHHMTLNGNHASTRYSDQPDIRPYRASSGSLLDNPDAYEFQPENRRNASGLGLNVPVQGIGGNERITVGRVPSEKLPPSNNAAIPTMDPVSVLLDRALDFTRHEPDADARYAPRLVACVAIPQTSVPTSGGSRKPQDHVQFLRVYAKALHAHSIRPAEFAEFLDGLNALCLASNAAAADLTTPRNMDTPASLVLRYISAANEAFFGPRGLRISLRPLSTLLNMLQIPEERGQRAGAIASVLDSKSTPEKKAQSLHPWTEALETNVPSPSAQSLLIQEMSKQFLHQSYSRSTPSINTEDGGTSKNGKKDNPEREHSNPPRFSPKPSPGPSTHTMPSFSPRDSWNRSGSWGRARGGRHGLGRSPFGGLGYGPFGPPGHGPFGGPWHGPHYRGGGCGSAIHGSSPSNQQTTNDWAAWGESMGKWGEEFGKRMEDWGQQFGKRAEHWGNDFGRRAGNWGEEIAARASEKAPANGSVQSGQQREQNAVHPGTPEALAGQETGVHREEGSGNITQPEHRDQAKGKEAKHTHEGSSISSDSSSESDSDSDSDEEEEFPDTNKMFLDRIREINIAAEASQKKGKKSAQEIASDRALAIEKAQNERTTLEHKIEAKRAKRAIKRELRQKLRDLKREHRHVKRQLRRSEGGKKGKHWKDAKRQYREKRREFRREKESVKRDWRDAKHDRRGLARTEGFGDNEARGLDEVWVVVENLAN